MDSIYWIIIVALLLLAAFDLINGVANDAVNFLNSAIGSKAAPVRAVSEPKMEAGALVRLATNRTEMYAEKSERPLSVVRGTDVRAGALRRIRSGIPETADEEMADVRCNVFADCRITSRMRRI